MEVSIYKGRKNDLVIGLIRRYVITGEDKTIVISIKKTDKEFSILQYGFDKKGEFIEDLEFTVTHKKKYFAIQEANKMVQKYVPTFAQKRVYKK